MNEQPMSALDRMKALKAQNEAKKKAEEEAKAAAAEKEAQERASAEQKEKEKAEQAAAERAEKMGKAREQVATATADVERLSGEYEAVVAEAVGIDDPEIKAGADALIKEIQTAKESAEVQLKEANAALAELEGTGGSLEQKSEVYVGYQTKMEVTAVGKPIHPDLVGMDTLSYEEYWEKCEDFGKKMKELSKNPEAVKRLNEDFEAPKKLNLDVPKLEKSTENVLAIVDPNELGRLADGRARLAKNAGYGEEFAQEQFVQAGLDTLVNRSPAIIEHGLKEGKFSKEAIATLAAEYKNVIGEIENRLKKTEAALEATFIFGVTQGLTDFDVASRINKNNGALNWGSTVMSSEKTRTNVEELSFQFKSLKEDLDTVVKIYNQLNTQG